ncbi:hypothetical protein [Flammeovirga sp. EKP202]|uniref:hypothetical protein n=1 Tax=Flammeovirga sp. EKP202 TaxID=2770592 RepID=UPI00165F6B8C|nr:hypothetical protein [Flammeovirga sp. EKP202]MBD0401399.1 hypothetical protein [Flammeovirga sp. EKP202]
MDLSPINNLPEKGEKIFKVWKRYAKEHFPYTDLYIEDLKNDILQALSKSLKDIERKGYHKHREKKSWVVGVFMEILAKNINQYWYNIFIIRDNKDFSGLLWLKAMLTHLASSQQGQIEVNRIYKHLLDKHYPFDQYDMPSNEEVDQNNLIADLNYQSNWTESEQYLTSLLKDRLSVTIDNRGPRLITAEKLYDIFSVDDIYNFTELNLYIKE